MKIITYNLNYRQNLAGQWAEISKLEADILLLQELRPPESWPALNLEPNYAEQFYWTRMNNNGGSAVYLKEGQGRRIDVPGCRGWAVGVELDQTHPANFQDKPLQVFSVHIADKPYLDIAMKVLTAIENLAGTQNLVIGGDFNLTMGVQGADRGGLVTSDAERQIIDFMRRRLGLMSAWQAANPNTQLDQTLCWNRDKSIAYHCDGIFVPASWYRYLDWCKVLPGEPGKPWLTLSDHNPVVASFTNGK